MNTYYGSFQKVPLTKPVSIIDIARFADRFGIITAEDVEQETKLHFINIKANVELC